MASPIKTVLGASGSTSGISTGRHPRNRFCHFALALLMLSGSLHEFAHARTAKADQRWCQGDRECASRCREARQLSQRGQLAEALAAYQAAYHRKPYGPILFNIARLHQKIGNLAEAARNYQLYLDSPVDGYPAQRPIARAHLAEVQGLLTASQPPLAPVKEPPPVALPTPLEPPAQLEPPAPAGPPTTSLAIIKTRPAMAPRRSPIYKRWWLWGVVGIVAAGAATGLGLGLVAKPPDDSLPRHDLSH